MKLKCCEIRVFFVQIDLNMSNACTVFVRLNARDCKNGIRQHCSELFRLFSGLTFEISLSCYCYDCYYIHDASRGMNSHYNAADYVCTFSAL